MGKETLMLQFQTPQDLTGFRKAASESILKTDIKNLIVVCNCSDKNVALAMNNFGAMVVQEKEG